MSNRNKCSPTENVAADVHALAGSLKQARAEGPTRLDPEIAKLSERLNALQAGIEQLGKARSSLIDEAIGRIGRALAGSLQKQGMQIGASERRHRRITSNGRNQT